jgi:hypothetical protein
VPFVDADGAEVTEVALLQRDAVRFQLLTGFDYLDPTTGERYTVPADDPSRPPDADGGNATDLASVPRFLWGLIPSYGLQTRAAVLHDHLVDLARRTGGADGARSHRRADLVFRTALVESGVPLFRAVVMWCGVCLYRYVVIRYGVLRAIAGTGLLALGVGAIAAALVLGLTVSPVWALLAVLPPALAPLARDDAAYFAVAPFVTALLSPFVAAAALGSALFALLGWVVELLAGRFPVRADARARARAAPAPARRLAP